VKARRQTTDTTFDLAKKLAMTITKPITNDIAIKKRMKRTPMMPEDRLRA